MCQRSHSRLSLVARLSTLTTASLRAVHWFNADFTPPWKFPQASCREDIDAHTRLSLRLFVSPCWWEGVCAACVASKKIRGTPTLRSVHRPALPFFVRTPRCSRVSAAHVF